MTFIQKARHDYEQLAAQVTQAVADGDTKALEELRPLKRAAAEAWWRMFVEKNEKKS